MAIKSILTCHLYFKCTQNLKTIPILQKDLMSVNLCKLKHVYIYLFYCLMFSSELLIEFININDKCLVLYYKTYQQCKKRGWGENENWTRD